MSSPLDRDFGPDEPSPYAPKWVREAADARRRKTADDAEAPSDAPTANVPDEDDPEPIRRGSITTAGSKDSVVVERYRLPPSLEPTLMPEPWPVPRTRSALALLMRFGVAAGIAAVVALLVVGKFPSSGVVAGKTLKQESSPSFGSRFSGQNARPSEAAAQLIPSQELPRAANDRPALGAAVTRATESASIQQPASQPVQTAAIPAETAPPAPAPAPVAAPPAPVATPPAPPPAAVAVPQAPPAPAKTFPIRRLDRDEIAELMRRGEAFIASGDLASARLVLQRAAEAGDPRAALTLAGTYDPIVLEKLGIQGFASDIAAARTWYERAKDFGSAEAMRRLEMLASRAH